MKLIKIKTDHYVMVDDSEIKVGDYYLRYNQSIMKCTSIKLQFNEALNKEETIISSDVCGDPYERSRNNLKKISHSTQPLGKPMLFTNAFESDLAITTMGLHDTVIENWGCKKLSLQEVKELLGEVDVEKRAEMLYPFAFGGIGNLENNKKEHWIKGYNQALEDNKEKEYTEEHLRKAMRFGSMRNKLTISELESSFQQLKQSLQPKTEWEVEYDENGKLKLV